MNQTEILRQERLKKAELEAKDKRHTELVSAVNNQTATTIKAFNAFTKYVDRKITKTEVVNQLKQIGTPDAMKVMSAVNDMHSTLKKLKNADLTPVAKLLEDLIGEVSQIPKESPEAVESVEINNLPDFDSYTTRIEQAVQALDVKPVVNVQAPQVTVKPADVHIEKQDFTTLEKALKQVVSAVENIVIPAQIPTDMTKVENKLDTANKHLEKISNKSFGGGGGSGGHTTPYVDADGKPVYVEREADGSVPTSISALPTDTYSAVATTESSSGDNVVVAITNSPRLYYISVSADGANAGDVTATVKIGASEKFKVSLKAGSIFARNIGAGRRYLTGSAGDDIIVNLSDAQTVHVSVEYEDI